MASLAILKAISAIVKTPVTYISIAEQNNKEFFLCFGQHAIFFLDSELNEIVAELFYVHIDKVINDPEKPLLIMLDLSSNRPANIPGKLILLMTDKLSMLDALQSCWKTDFMFRLGKVGTFPLSIGKINKRYKKEVLLARKNIPLISLSPPDDAKRHEIKNYVFFVPQEFLPEGDAGNFMTEDQAQRIVIQVGDTISLDKIIHFKQRKDLSYYAEDYAQSLVSNEERYWIMFSDQFLKGGNMNNDKALWKGWQVHIRTNSRDILVILLRRKFIPPVMDSFADIFLTIFGPERKVSVKDRARNFPDTKIIIDKLRAVADTVHAASVNNKLYTMIIQEQLNALSIDEDAFYFFQTRPLKQSMNPGGLVFGIAYIENILKMLMRLDRESNEILVKALEEKFSDIINDPGNVFFFLI